MKNSKKSILVIQGLLLLVALNLNAQHAESASKKHQKEGHHATAHEKGHSHKNHLAMITGMTSNLTHHNNLFMAGLDYEYRISELIGVGLTGEYLTGESTEMIVGIPVFFHATKQLKIITAPILIFAQEHSESSEHHEHEGAKMSPSFAGRIGVGYDFHINKISVGPLVNFDFGKTTAITYGLSIGFGF